VHQKRLGLNLLDTEAVLEPCTIPSQTDLSSCLFTLVNYLAGCLRRLSKMPAYPTRNFGTYFEKYGIWLNRALFLTSHNICFATLNRNFISILNSTSQSQGRIRSNVLRLPLGDA
jgi:hypothetical protein